AVTVALGELGYGLQLLAGHAPAQHRGSHISQAGLTLGMNADMIAKVLVGNLLRDARRHAERDARLHLFEEPFRVPALAQKKVFEAGAVTASPQHHLIAEDFGDSLSRGRHLLGRKESVKTNSEVRLIGEADAHAEREANFSL